MSSADGEIPEYMQMQESLTRETKELIWSLPRESHGWFDSWSLFLYQGFWYQPDHLQGVISCQRHFEARDSDVLLVSFPKCGTTWLKAIVFAILNRERFPPATKDHPLLTNNPHDLVLNLEINLYGDVNNQVLPNDDADAPSRRCFATHMPHASLPESAKSKCKVVYACRNAKDAFVSLWHFMNKLRPQHMGEDQMEKVCRMFCDGVVLYGPLWDHVLEYWDRSREDPDRVLFVRYEELKEEGAAQVRRIAEFLDCGFSAEEEAAGVAEEIVRLTSFETMSGLQVNGSGKKGKSTIGIENKHFFREGVVGDGNKYLSPQMVQWIDQIVEHKFSGTGLKI